MLLANNLTKKYGSLCVLQGVSLEIQSGEMVSLLGTSGAGKSTLLQLLGTLDTPDSGEIFFNQIDILKMSAKQQAIFRNQQLGFIFQFHQLIPELTACENVTIPALISGKLLSETRQRAEELLAILGLEGRKDHKPNELSGGEQQRVAVARALMNRPKLILADEPTGNLDSKNSELLFQLFRELADNQQTSLLIATHNPTLANMAHRKLFIQDGRFVAEPTLSRE
ncbi:MAG: ABC transporter ATP-binding protein [Bacteroidia bacterium]|nr:ABC transporter ATP-binding protein [Bacteroidia bacterium]